MCSLRCASVLGLVLIAPLTARAADDNWLTYLDDNNPYYVGRHSPRLVTPQWVGEDGVEAVVILAIDDLREPEKYEKFLRPILQRLKKIDGRAPVSIMSNKLNPDDPQLQAWLKEGLSLETHTLDHPCPFWTGGDFAKANATYEGCVDLLNRVPGNRPVAFRMPCCDSLNTPSPRFYAELFSHTTAKGNFLTIDSSVFNILTSNDPELPRELVQDADGQDRFRKYLPADRTFVNTIEDYPYPYVIGRKCWEFPCVLPSDWLAFHRQEADNPATVRDWKAGLDATVIKQGVFTMVFHPHGWIRSEQIEDLIDHAETKHGKKVKFLTFREAQERLDKNLLGGHPLRDPRTGEENGVQVSGSGDFVSVYIRNEKEEVSRHWERENGKWGWKLDHTKSRSAAGIGPFKGYTILWPVHVGGKTTMVGGNGTDHAVFDWSDKAGTYVKTGWSLPPGARLSDGDRDYGLRFIDLDGDGNDDIVFSNETEYGIYLFTDMEHGWSRKVMAGKAGDKGALPMIARDRKNNGFFVHSRSLWWQNENTDLLKDHVDRRSFNELLMSVEPTAKTPPASLRSIQTRPGFQVELVAAEPLIESPIAFAWGEDGKLWVVEMRDYPLGLDNKGKPGGRIVYLEDTNGDGKYTKSTVFLDGLNLPTAVLPWHKGVIVVAAPEIFYAEDTKGTGKADLRVSLYTGLGEGNPQHRANSLAWGLDNWIYCANGDSGGLAKSVKTGAGIELRGHDFRIRPDEGAIDAQAGQTQYGRSRDDWGNWFGNNNSDPMWQYVLADQYVRRNPHVAAPDPRVRISVTPGAAPVYPISRTLPRFNDPEAANHFTSACSAIVYRDDLFGPLFAGNCFVSEPVHNLVHREIMTPKGVTFTSRRAPDEQQSEFLASSDNWTRPTTIQTGPDGALWVADMYRAVIEHPEWIPIDWQKRLDLRAGADKGRIYRVYPVGTRPRTIPRLDRLDTAGLVAALDSPSGWQRDTAQQMLLWRKDAAAVPLLEKLAAEAERPLARLHALCTLDGLGALKPALLVRALEDAHPGVRRHAVRLCEGRLNESPELGAALVKRVADADPAVRLQLACTLGAWDDARAGDALGQLALRDAGERFIAAAVMTSVNRKNLDRVLLAVMTSSRKGPPPAALVENLLRMANALNDTQALTTLLKAVATPEEGKYAPWQFAALAGLLDALDQGNRPLAKLRDEGGEEKAAVDQLAGLFAAARATLADAHAAKDDPFLAVRLLGRGLDHRQEDVAALAGLLVPQTADDLQAAAIAALGRLREPKVPELLLRGWPGYGPAQRNQVLDVLLRRDEWLKAALDAIEAKQVAAAEVSAPRRQRLLQHRDPAVRERAARLFADAVNPDRQKVLDAYQEVLGMKGDPERGAEMFSKNCATCHQLNGVGHAVGPDLASLGDKSPQGLLIAILDPNRAVEARYVSYTAATKAGLTYTGVLGSETGNSITIVAQDGKQQVILRTELDELSSTGKSLMPEGLEKEVKPQDMADLIAHLRSVGPQPQRKTFAGNTPELVRPGGDGALVLSPANAEIYGPTVVLEDKYGNLGYWTSEQDHATWSVEVARAGKYAVWLDWACDEGSAGKTFLLEAGPNQVTGKVESTGNWDTYRQAKVGEIVLPAGRQRLTFRSAGRIFTPLIDLKSVKLVPVE
jgi:putative membrane-bound dehydrogenase-like protein